MSRSSTRAQSKPKLASKKPAAKPGPGGKSMPRSSGRVEAPRSSPSGLRRAAPWLAAGAVAVLAVAGVALVRGADDGGGGSGSGTAPTVGGDLHSLVVDPAQPDRLFVGGHQAAATSSDAGRSWAQVASLRDADAMGWAFLDGAVWMGGHPGLRRSTDGGATFAPAGGQLSSTDVHALGGADGVLYAASPGRGLLASTDDGATWQVRSSTGKGFMGGIVVDPADAEHLFAPDMQAGAMESRDGGTTWQALRSPGMAMSVTAVEGDVTDLIVAGGGTAARSTDGGVTWSPIDVPAETMVVTAGRDTTLYAAALDGTTAKVSASTDGGTTWQPLT